MEAANGGHLEVGTVLIQSHAEVNTSPVPTSRDTALTIAADKGHSGFVELLLRNEAHINSRNKKGCTALWLVEFLFKLLHIDTCENVKSCNGGHLDAVKVLIENGADTDSQDNRKLTPLMVAFRKGHSKAGFR